MLKNHNVLNPILFILFIHVNKTINLCFYE